VSEATKDQIKVLSAPSKSTNRESAAVPCTLLTLLAIIGPGLIVMVGDNDAGGVSTYAQAGQNFGYTLLWTLPLLIPVLIVNQEMVVRLGAVTGIGHGRLIRERVGRRWGNVSIGSILLLNFLIIITEFIGISLSMEYFGVSAFVSVPIAVVALFGVTATGSFQRWERFMMLFVAVNVVMIPLVLHAHVATHSLFRDLAVPGIRGGTSRRACCSSSRSSARPSRRGSCTSSRATSSTRRFRHVG